jgi:hypothetical protein
MRLGLEAFRVRDSRPEHLWPGPHSAPPLAGYCSEMAKRRSFQIWWLQRGCHHPFTSGIPSRKVTEESEHCPETHADGIVAHMNYCVNITFQACSCKRVCESRKWVGVTAPSPRSIDPPKDTVHVYSTTARIDSAFHDLGYVLELSVLHVATCAIEVTIGMV